MKKFRLGLLPRIIIAIILGILFGNFLPVPAVRLFATFNSIFSNFLQFLIPLIILGLVTPAIADIGKGAGKLLAITALIAYLDTVGAGLISYFTSATLFPNLIPAHNSVAAFAQVNAPGAYFTINIPPILDVMTSLVASFTLGLGIAFFSSPHLKELCNEFKDIVVKTIEVVILPLLPVYIFGIFLSMTHTGQAMRVISVFISVIGIIFVMHVVLLLLQYIERARCRIRIPSAFWRI